MGIGYQLPQAFHGPAAGRGRRHWGQGMGVAKPVPKLCLFK